MQLIQKIVQIGLDEKETTVINVAIQQLKKAKMSAKRFFTQCKGVMSESSQKQKTEEIETLEETLAVLSELIKPICMIRMDMLNTLWNGLVIGQSGRWSGFYFHYSEAIRMDLKEIINAGQRLFDN